MDYLQNFHVIDLLIGVFLFWRFSLGYSKDLLATILSGAVIIGSVYIGFNYGDWIRAQIPVIRYLMPITPFILTFWLLSKVQQSILMLVGRKFLKFPFSRLAAGVLSMGVGLVVIAIIISIVFEFKPDLETNELWVGSYSQKVYNAISHSKIMDIKNLVKDFVMPYQSFSRAVRPY